MILASCFKKLCFDKPFERQDDVMKMPLYPTEDLIWDPNLVPEEHYSGSEQFHEQRIMAVWLQLIVTAGDYSLALPKLNLQFLTIHVPWM